MATRRTRTVKDIPVTSEISAMIAAIGKQYGENTIVKGSEILQPWRIPTGIFTFDYATLGGIPHNRVTVFDGAKHSGKGGLASDRVYTPDGPVRYRDLRVGSAVIGADGRRTTVTGVFPRGTIPVYKVTFTDGTSVTVDGDHLWHVQTKKQVALGTHSVLQTRDLLDAEHRVRSGGYRYRIPTVKPVQFAGSELPVEPYLLGVLLANGSIGDGKPQFCTNDEGVISQVRERNPDLHIVEYERHTARRFYVRGGRPGVSNSNPITEYLKLADLAQTSCFKRIPEQYLYASEADRRMLLGALLDCDGSVTVTRSHHHTGGAKYHTRSQHLALGVVNLVQSLGGVATVCIQEREDGIDYQVNITHHECLFVACDRKRDIFLSRGHRAAVRSIVSVEPAGEEEVICISVAARDCLYVTEQYIVTHNTTCALRAIAGAQQSMPDQQAVFVDIEGTFDATYAEKLGVDTDALLVVQPDTGEHAVDIMTGLIHTKEVSLIIGDSLAALLPIKESEASAEDTLVGQQSRLIATMMRKTTAALIKERKRQHYVTLLFINQQRSKIGARSPIPGGEVLSNPGGKAVGFFSTLECTWKNKENIKSNGNGEETLHTNDHAFHIKKNKLHAGMRQGEFQVMRRPDEDMGLNEGDVDDAGTMITFAKRLGWYTGGGRAGYTLSFGEHSYHEPNADAMCRYLYQDRDAYWALRQHLIADSAERLGMKPEFVAYLRGE